MMAKDEKENLGFYGRLFNDAGVAMVVLDSDGLVLAGNRKFDALLESLSPRYGDLLREGHFTLFRSSLLPLTAGPRRYAFFEGPLYLRSPAGDTLQWFSVHAWRIKGAGPGQSSPREDALIAVSLENNTLVRQEEKKLQADMLVAEKAMEAKDQFLANMSHEIRTPIQTIIGMTELLEATRLNHEQAEYARQVNFSAEVLLALINDILDYSKIEAGKVELERIDFDLEQTIEQAVEMITLEAHKKDLYIATDIPLAANIIVRGDPVKFRQIVINLVKNAVKFTREGGVVVSAALTELNGAEALRVSVEDTGIGVSEEARPKLFSSFVQGDVSTTRRFGGTGLGLAISRDLVRLMKGTIETVPNEGGGSIFRFVIPLERSAKKSEPLPPPERNGKLRVLVVDACVREREIIVSYLRDLGYNDVVEAGTGEAALETLRTAASESSAFHLCFIDMTLPVMDGWRLAAEINNDRSWRPPELVLMMPRLIGGDAKMTLLKWFKAYINKPVRRRRLADTIAAILNEPGELEELHEEPGLSRAGGRPIDRTAGLAVPRPGTRREKPLVLIAEDHPVNQKLFLMILDKLGYPAIPADDGMDALEKALTHEVALVFMDIQMPRMNGYEAAGSLRKRGFGKPIIAVTASALSDEREHCLKAGIDDVLIKPFKQADIEAMLLKWGGEAGADSSTFPAEGGDSSLSGRSPRSTVFDPAELSDTFMKNDDMAKPLLLRFIERTQGQLARLPGLIKTGDWESAHREAHMIKGAALTMSGIELGNAAARMEKALKDTDREEIRAAYPAALEAFGLFKKAALEFALRETPKEGT